MSARSQIQWTQATWNPLAGCDIVSKGCRGCYAMRDAHRLAGNPNPKVARKYAGTTKLVKGRPVWTGRINLADDAALTQPLRWKNPRLIFVNSMSDLFAEAVPDHWIDLIFAVMALCPQHTFQVLTKRPERAREYLADPTLGVRVQDVVDTMEPDGIWQFQDHEPWIADNFPLPNVWLGTSVEDQATADERIPILLDTPAALRWISAEPLLGPVDVSKWVKATGGASLASSPTTAASATPCLDWVVVGGESGPRARPMHPDWVCLLRDQCAAAGTPFFFKQWGAWSPGQQLGWIDTHRSIVMTADGSFVENGPDAQWSDEAGSRVLFKVGKKLAGRHFHGVTHDAFPPGEDD